MNELHWVSRPVEPENMFYGWIRRVPGDRWSSELAERTRVHIVERQGQGCKISDPALKRSSVSAGEVDCGREWKLESEWLPENHPMVQAMLKKRLGWLQSEPLREGESREKREAQIAEIAWVLERNQPAKETHASGGEPEVRSQKSEVRSQMAVGGRRKALRWAQTPQFSQK